MEAVKEGLREPLIFKLIGKAIGEVGAIKKEKEAKNYAGKKMYNFRGIDDVYNAINPVFAKYGLFIIPEILEKNREERERTSGEKGVLIYSILTVKFTIYGPDGSSVSGTTIGEAMDTGDKSMNKAMSAALKYFLFQTLMIPTEELIDPDAEVHDPAPRRLPSQRQTPAAIPPKNGNVEKADSGALPPEAKTPAAPAKKPATPARSYINSELPFIAAKLGYSDIKDAAAWFAERRQDLIDSGSVENVSSDDMSLEQAKSLVEAVYVTFLGESDVQ